MKKIISIILVVMMSASLFACSDKTDIKEPVSSENIVDTDNTEAEEKEEVPEEEKEAEAEADEKEEEKPADKPEEKPADKPEENKTEEKPADKPEENKTEEKPEENKPAEQAPATLGSKLLAAFKANASSKSGEALANAILSIPEIQFSPVVMPVEEGLLTGFVNNEIKGFKSGTVFAPMIGSIPFVGYIFELENEADVPDFISTLKSSANPRWNVCSEADEMITGSSGNIVFFVMCPASFEE